ncbi:MAG: inorganic phosphate transporter family protein [Candidatus Omnitrophica bacterium]|nr:inorganic phosphate transporter family protein [Candidatus Omnitrophota bacterium]
MEIILLGLTLLCGGYIGWAIGANDAANCVGADIGSGKMTLKQGIAITCVFSFLGAILLGSKVIKTVGKGIVALDQLEPQLSLLVALAACFGAGTWVIIATMRGLPVSTSHSIVGAVGGAGLAIGAPVIWKKLLDIFICWFLTPIGAAILSYLLFRPFRRLFYMVVPRKFHDPVVTFFIFATSIYLAFTWGGNDVANATGVLAGVGIMSSKQAAAFGAIAIVIGIITLGRKVIQTIGFKITRLTPLMTIVAEIASGINVHVYTIFGIPVSTSHSIIGAVAGVGLVKGIKMINKRLIGEIILVWSLTPLASGILSYLTIRFIKLFFR